MDTAEFGVLGIGNTRHRGINKRQDVFCVERLEFAE